MSNRGIVVRASALHALALEQDGIRQADTEEWVGGVAGPVLPALLSALKLPSSRNDAYLKAGKVLCLWGTHPAPFMPPDAGQVWFIASKDAERHAIEIHHQLKPVLQEMHTRFPLLVAYTHPRNVVHHLWMERNGFVLVPDAGFVTVLGIPYLTYTRTTP